MWGYCGVMSGDRILAPHRSIRVFRNDPLPEGTTERLVAEAQRAPTDATGQMYTFVRILDRTRRRRIAEFSGDQQHVLDAAEFLVACADVRRLARVLGVHGRELGAFPATALHFAVIDAALATQRLIDAAEAIGLGTVCIGGILSGMEELIEALALPRGVLPLFGLCVGWPGEAPVERPRVALSSVLHEDTYHDLTPEAVAADVATMAPVTRSGDWPAVLARYFAGGGTMEEREPALRRALERQGFAWR
jgi:FMN reductase (NADPH)